MIISTLVLNVSIMIGPVQIDWPYPMIVYELGTSKGSIEAYVIELYIYICFGYRIMYAWVIEIDHMSQ